MEVSDCYRVIGRSYYARKGTSDKDIRISGPLIILIMHNEVQIVKPTKGYPVLLTTCLLSLGMSSGVQADGAELFKTRACFSCHGMDGNTPISPEFPKIAGQNAGYAFNQMRDIKNGARSNGQSAAMKGIMAAVSEEEMKEIAAWLRSLRKP